jgi:RimJ/RimL family protein N-acetyltransferase
LLTNRLLLGTPHAYVVEGNTSSERLFEGLGFRKVARASWIFPQDH